MNNHCYKCQNQTFALLPGFTHLLFPSRSLCFHPTSLPRLEPVPEGSCVSWTNHITHWRRIARFCPSWGRNKVTLVLPTILVCTSGKLQPGSKVSTTEMSCGRRRRTGERYWEVLVAGLEGAGLGMHRAQGKADMLLH